MSEAQQEKPSKAKNADPQPLPSVEHLFFNLPLYVKNSITYDQIAILFGRATNSSGRLVAPKIDGYCLLCKKDSTFSINAISIPGGDPWNNVETRYAFDNMAITCVREDHHRIRYNLLVHNMTVMKVGQHPSLADIAINETRQKYRTVLRGDNWSELYKAIGLAAHGEGIGSFVYLRRVFERLIQSRFDEFKSKEHWDESAFQSQRMDEKIGLLKDHLPRSLVETRKIYKIFSSGIHELKNETCLEFFDVGKRSIIMILEDDLKTQQELADRKQLTEAVAKFGIAPEGDEIETEGPQAN
jgi:hypothetical protein